MSLKRQQIVDAIITRLKAISTAGGYYNNFADVGSIEKVFDNRVTEFNESELPAINVVDKDEDPNLEMMAGSRNPWYRSLQVDINLIVTGETSMAEVRKGISDIQKAIGTDETWGALAIDTRWDGTENQYNQEEDLFRKVSVQITVIYQTREWLEDIS
ncbi:MAG: hypothetical protein ACYC09_12985 [Bacteroidota bacterium]